MSIWIISIVIAATLISVAIRIYQNWAKKINKEATDRMKKVKRFYCCPRCGSYFLPAKGGEAHLQVCPNCKLSLNVWGATLFSQEDIDQKNYYKNLDMNKRESWFIITARLIELKKYKEAKESLEVIKKFPNLNSTEQQVVEQLTKML